MRAGTPQFLSFCALTMLAGCQTAIIAQPAEMPAVLVPPFSSAQAEIQTHIVDMLHVKTVILADDAFVNDSVLVLQRRWPRDASGQLLNGRELEYPEMFRLLLIDAQCVLVQLRTGNKEVLQHSQCKAQARP